MKQVVLSRAGVEVRDVPAPQVEPGALLVRVARSCISVGTEMSGVRASNLPLWKRAMQRPEQVRQLAQIALKHGVDAARTLVANKLAEAHPIGYSAAGRVVAVGEGITDFAVGDRVACAGSQSAFHAEYICVPRNLCAPVPDGVSDAEASTVTLGAIAMQGVRRLEPTLGEAVVVIGLGILGQLTVQLLKSAGARTIGIDIDHRRLDEARAVGLDIAIHPADADPIAQVQRLTDGQGSDGVIVTAASSADDIISMAFRMCRRKARVVLVGDVGLDLKREDIYAKELDFRVSTSYGPGRYDRNYEEAGLDYPIGYVRWTENRNMAEYLRQIADRRVHLVGLDAAVHPVERAADAYASLSSSAERPLFAFLDYGTPQAPATDAGIVRQRRLRPAQSGKIRLALVGAGGFAKSTHLPLLQTLRDQFDLAAIVSRRGLDADNLARLYGAGASASDIDAVLGDAAIDAVLITTRHDSHAALVEKALSQGKHVFVEKPLCLSRDELSSIEALVARLGDACPVLMTGFNRRFAPHIAQAKAVLGRRTNPFILNYRVNAGYIPLDHWVHKAAGGGRNIGEACHFYDLIGYLAGKPVTAIEARSIAPATAYYARNDNFIATMTFGDGSVASLTYTSQGSTDQPKEMIDVYSDGQILQLVDFRSFTVSGAKPQAATLSVADKGHRAELQAFAQAVSGKADWPVPLREQAQAMRIAFDVEAALQGGQA